MNEWMNEPVLTSKSCNSRSLKLGIFPYCLVCACELCWSRWSAVCGGWMLVWKLSVCQSVCCCWCCCLVVLSVLLLKKVEWNGWNVKWESWPCPRVKSCLLLSLYNNIQLKHASPQIVRWNDENWRGGRRSRRQMGRETKQNKMAAAVAVSRCQIER